MLTAAAIIFGVGVFGIAYPLVLYPLILRLLPRRFSLVEFDEEYTWPRVSLTIPVYNEERTLRDTLESVQLLDYPRDRFQVLVVSDASTDRTDDIAREFSTQGVELLRLDERRGKTAAENAARKRLTGDIIVNTDASIRIEPYAIKLLVAQFVDPTVGVASGRDMSVPPTDSSSTGSEANYVDGEIEVQINVNKLPSVVNMELTNAVADRDHTMEWASTVDI